MRTMSATLAALGVALALTACSSGDAKQGSAPASPSATGDGTPGPVPACVTGTWRSTSATAAGGAIGKDATGTISGGQDVMLTIGGDGTAKVDFASMRPVAFAVSAPAGNAKGEYSYRGTVTGTLRFPGGAVVPSGTPSGSSPASPAPTSSASPEATGSAGPPTGTGTWQPTGDVKWDDLRLTLKLTEPLNQTLLDDARISGVSSGQISRANDVVDLQPVLRPGTYTCGDGTLTVQPQTGPAVTWMFRRG